jgi:tetratricopeptide (TPR) repeat protein
MATKKTGKTKKTSSKASTQVLQQWPWLQRTRLLAGLLFVLSVLIYANTFTHDYAQDDAIVITDNMFTQEGFSGIPGLFKYDTFYGFFKVEGKAKLVAGGRYRPLTPAMFAVEYGLFGDRPGVMHFFNALWYGLTVVMLYWVFLALLEARRSWDKRLSLAASYGLPVAAALLFATHPVHTEAVANIKGRDEIITLLGSLTALWLVLKYRRSEGAHWAVLAGIAFFLGLLAKENAITFLGVVPLALFVFTRDGFRKIALAMIPLVIAAVVFLGIRGAILGWDLGEPSRELMNNPFLKLEEGRWVDFTGSEKAATITYTLAKYAQLLVVPAPLVHDYYPRHVAVMSWGDWRVLLSLFLYLGLLAWALWGLKHRKMEAFAVLTYLGTLSIVSNIVFPVGTNMSERFLFMPSVGFAFLLPLLLWQYLGKLRIAVLVTTAVSAVFAILTIARNPAWENNFTLFSTDIHKAPNSAKLRNAMAGELSVQWFALPESTREGRRDMLEEALGHVTEAIRIHPTYKQAYYIKGNTLNYLRRYDESVQAYQQALQIDPAYELAEENMYITYRDAGRYYGEQQGDLANAIRYLEQAYQGRPTDYETVRLLGVAYGISGNAARAIELFQKNTQLNPSNARAWWDLGTAYYNAGQTAEGQAAINEAKRLDPDIEQKVNQGG